MQKDFPAGYHAFMSKNGIKHHVFDMKGTKKEDIPIRTMKSILRLVLDRRNHPVLIHCNHGRVSSHATATAIRSLLGRFHANGICSTGLAVLWLPFGKCLAGIWVGSCRSTKITHHRKSATATSDTSPASRYPTFPTYRRTTAGNSVLATSCALPSLHSSFLSFGCCLARG